MEYTTSTAVKNYLQTEIASGLNSQITDYIQAISEFVDNEIGYPLYSTIETTRKYDGSGTGLLDVDPVHTITEVTVDGSVVSPVELPYNEDVKEQLRLSTGTFGASDAGVEVTGIFSKSKTLPKSITHAVTILVGLIVRQLKDQSDGIQSEKIGDYTVSFKSEKDRLDYELAMKIIDGYKPIVF